MRCRELFERMAREQHMDLTVWHGSYVTGPTNQAWKFYQLGFKAAQTQLKGNDEQQEMQTTA